MPLFHKKHTPTQMLSFILALVTILLLTMTLYVIYEIIDIYNLSKKYALQKINCVENDELLKAALSTARSRARQNSCLMIKINGYPSVGKTSFIKKKGKKYQTCNFYDFDDFNGIERTAQLLLNYSKKYRPGDKKIMVLFGGNKPIMESDLEEVIQLTVLPRFPIVCRNLILRKGIVKGIKKRIGLVSQKTKYTRRWENNENVMRGRFKASDKCYCPNKRQVQLCMKNFEEPIDILIKAYTEELERI